MKRKAMTWGLALGCILGASVVVAGTFTKGNNIQKLPTLLYEHGSTVEAAAGLSGPNTPERARRARSDHE